MASLHFNFSAMNAGKSIHLLSVAHNYEERGMRVLLLKPKIDDRDGDTIHSRIGLSRPCVMIGKDEDPLQTFLAYGGRDISCVLVDEAQFLTRDQVISLTKIVDWYDTPVMCYGLLSDSNGGMFEGSQALTIFAEKKIEHKTICWCGKKATMNMRLNSIGEKVVGDQVCIGGNDRYISVCRKHWDMGQSTEPK